MANEPSKPPKVIEYKTGAWYRESIKRIQDFSAWLIEIADAEGDTALGRDMFRARMSLANIGGAFAAELKKPDHTNTR